MDQFNPELLKQLYVPPANSHKGQNGKVMVIAGSRLFHAASLWPLDIASKIVDMVFFSSVDENNDIVTKTKEHWRNGIVVPRGKIDDYITDADAVLIGPGLPRENGVEAGDDDTRELTERLLKEYPQKKWIIDGGSLQTISPEILPKNSILTPHVKEFEKLFGKGKGERGKGEDENGSVILGSPDKLGTSPESRSWTSQDDVVSVMAKKYHCVILLKGQEDSVCSPDECVIIPGGNAGMTKGGTGDVLAGLTAALYAQNDDPFLVATCSSYINKKAGESLYKRAGLYFNASDLVEEIPKVMKELL